MTHGLRTPAVTALAALAALPMLVAACGGDATGASTAGELASGVAEVPTVLAAASLTEVLPALDPSARFSFGGSDQLAFQVEQGAPADVFAAASPRYAQALFRKGLVTAPRTFATNSVVVLVPRANPAGITSVTDLARPGVKVVMASPGVPAGDYARAALGRLGLRGVLPNVVSEEPDVKGVTAKVALGEADAGFAYATDARPVRGRVRAIALPAAAAAVAEYQVAVVTDAPHPAAARAFVSRLLSPEGHRVLVAHGFRVPGR